MKKIQRLVSVFILLLIVLQAESMAGETGVKRHTWVELRDKNVVKQQLDASCGAAALTTLMAHYFGEETVEKEILDILKVRHKNLTKKELARKKKNGFSLLDLKYAAQQRGYKAAGFKLTFEQLRQLTAPVIVYVKPFGYHHFAVLRGIAGDRVFLADPSRGNLRLSAAHFQEEYGGIIFVLGKAGEENIVNYPLALSRPDDYVRPDLRRLNNSINSFQNHTINLTLRARLR
ncbi:MAG: C39 family peptidase [Methylococcales bacterium]